MMRVFLLGSAKDYVIKDPFMMDMPFPLSYLDTCVQDIDTEEDWERAELMFRVLNSDECPE